ncbi:unnamed protein product [Caenorhabditis auriculariae]|uniref:Uncharacterized protein n=1 Tax=Caenorhabditis auriculariae TaxID=2777116 RepID=A0A8S1HCL6_9PELO|nr:unnamed protein product [Caenorhabditis auriculariae]
MKKKEVREVSSNVSKALAHLGSTNSPLDDSSNDLVEKCSLILDELRTISILASAQTEECSHHIEAIGKDLKELKSLLDSLDGLAIYVAQKKEQLAKLEKLCDLVEAAKRK